jgi:site-specific DNA recombinase
MTPTYAVKNGVRYRYYISAPLVQGQPQNAAPINRVPAMPIEKLIIAAVRNHLKLNAKKVGPNGPDLIADVDLTATRITRVDVKQDHLAIQLSPVPDASSADRNDPKAKLLIVPWKKLPSKQPRQIIPPAGPSPRQDQRPIRAETRAKLIAAIATARQWLDELMAGTMQTVEQIANRETCSIRQVNRTITLAFLAPSLVQAAVEGRLPRGIGVARLRDLPTEWASQYEHLGLARPEPRF